MKQITINGYMQATVAEAWRHGDGDVVDGIHYRLCQYKEWDGLKLAATVSVTFEVPDDFSPVPEAIAELEAKRTELLADTQVKVNQINDKINKMQALTYEAPEVPA